MSSEAAPPSDSGERRVFARHEYSVEVSLQSDHNFFAGFTRDISKGGVFVATPEPGPVGQRLSLKFSLPSAGPFEVQAEVRWTTRGGDGPPGMGLMFINLPAEAAKAIAEFLKKRESILFEEM